MRCVGVLGGSSSGAGDGRHGLLTVHVTRRRTAVAHNCAGAKLDGTLGGNIAWGERDGGGKCLEINGTNGHVSFGTLPELHLTGAFTIAGFIRPDSAPSNYVGLFWHFDGNGYEVTMNASGALYTQVAFATANLSVFPGQAIKLGVWQHVAAVLEPGVRFELYFDRQSMNKKTMLGSGDPLPSTGATSSPAEVRIGSVFDGTTTWGRHPRLWAGSVGCGDQDTRNNG